MTVGQLVKKLQAEDQGRVVVMSIDAEGNGHARLGWLYTGAYRRKTGEVGLEKLTDADRRDGYTEEDVVRHGSPALILTPE